jgi:putative membrane protein
MTYCRLTIYFITFTQPAKTAFSVKQSFKTCHMEILAKILVALVALEHLYILYIEMFAWETRGKKTFKSMPPDLFTPTKTLAANQGLYNGFLAAGLIWSVLVCNRYWSVNIAIFFLGCVIVAGIYGAATASKRIFFVQAVPAILALVFVLLSR